MSPIADAIGEDTYEQVRDFLRYAFPDAGPIDDATVDGFVRGLALYYNTELVDYATQNGERKGAEMALRIAALPHDLLRPLDFEHPGESGAKSYPLYTASAVHQRVRSMNAPSLGAQSNVPFESRFEGELSVVRVPLPPSYPIGSDPTIATPIGNVLLSSDHLVGSLELIADKFHSRLGYRPERVELVTPARHARLSWRFAPIAIYLGYERQADPTPSFYLLEAGMATGEAKTLYFARDMATTIESVSGYTPTPFSSEVNHYTGTLVVEKNEPVSLCVRARPKGLDHYFQVSITYKRTPSGSNPPLIVEAAGRVALIARKMGVPSGMSWLVEISALVVGETASWSPRPAYGGPSALPTTTPCRKPEPTDLSRRSPQGARRRAKSVSKKR